MLFDRDPILTLVSDKLAVREYVAECVGEDFLVPLLWEGEDPDEIPIEELPSKFVIKTNHGAGYYIVVTEKSDLNWLETKNVLSSWLRENYCEDKYLGIEWGYKNIHRRLIVETSLVIDGKLPVDYKFFCFSGRVEFVYVHYDRIQGQKVKVVNREFEDLDWDIECGDERRILSRPKYFEKMIEIAEKLSPGFGFIRVDLYCVNDHVFFGELTPYPGGVGIQMLPEDEDLVYGEKWRRNQNLQANFGFLLG